MIRSTHVKDDLKIVADKKEAVTLADVAHVLSLQCKILMDIKQNQVTIMKNKGIKLTTVERTEDRREG